MILVDTNVLVRLTRRDDPDHKAAANALRKLRIDGPTPAVLPQNLYEYWVVATRPVSSNGLGIPADGALQWLAYVERTCCVLSEPPDTRAAWENLLRAYRPLGKKAHDARLVAAMHLLGIDSILTFNADDFARYDVTVADPRTMAAL